MTSAPPDPMLGRLIDGRYQVRSRIARGGMATVYLATDLRLERQVAIKIMHGHLADDAVFKERFVQEARSAARLAHPNVVNVFDQGQDSDMAYLVMEYLPGMTLRDLLKDYGKLTTEQTVDVMDAVLGGLAAAHKAGIVHRDLKPENVLLADDGRIKISDFGLARAVSANTATGQALLGTIAYLSPELLTRGTADARSDIYAAGIMMYEMLVGAQPYVGEQPMAIAFQHANDQMPTPSSANPDVPDQLDDLVLWATSKSPDDRPTDAREMLERLRSAEGEIAGSRRSPNATGRTVVMPPDTFDADLDQAQTQVLEARRRTDPLSILDPDASATTVYGSSVASRPGAGASAPAGGGSKPPRPGAQERLDRKASGRRKRGAWIFVIVVVLAAALGGGAWYFGAGPGAKTTVTDVAGQSSEQAVGTLTQLGFKPTAVPQSNPTVASGTVISTDPTAGSSVQSGAEITVYVSSGPAMLDVPTLAGLKEADAVAALQQAGFTSAGSTQQFKSDVPAGIVIAPLGADGNVLGKQYGDQQPVTLVVSLGPVPDVVGQTLEEAQATLFDVGLSGVEGSQDFSDDIPEGEVYQAVVTTDPVRPGDQVTLNISRGPEPVTVPSGLNGMSWTDAKPKLVALGFDLQYNAVADAFPDTFKVSATDPASGTSVPRGTKLIVSFSVF
ncbi:Stk1 family PASTA domain-containing Ser/Thr kinase [Herbiconiux solani]|uniref:Stk1 family PASTA domain-containing Ser/Thr kinase n=1 Tax=Herbiconiux solani TaxID=661329 RepID=UPI000824E2F7|nr:Stk1 family PASTA domain-containing Ser/Thr kinase [Herbiconiux solani]